MAIILIHATVDIRVAESKARVKKDKCALKMLWFHLHICHFIENVVHASVCNLRVPMASLDRT